MQISFSIPLEAGFNLIPCCKEQQHSPPTRPKTKALFLILELHPKGKSSENPQNRNLFPSARKAKSGTRAFPSGGILGIKPI